MIEHASGKSAAHIKWIAVGLSFFIKSYLDGVAERTLIKVFRWDYFLCADQ